MSMRNMVAMFGAMAVLRKVDQEEPLVLLYARIGYLAYVAVGALIYALLHFRIIARRDATLISVPISKGPSLMDSFEQARKAAEKAELDRLAEETRDKRDDSSVASSASADSAAKRKLNKKPSNPVANATNAANASANSVIASASPAGGADGVDGSDDTDDVEDAEEPQTEMITVMEYDLRQLASARRSWVTGSCFLAAVHYHMQSVSPLIMSAVMGVLRLITEDPLVQIHLRGAPVVGKLTRPFTAEKNPLAALMELAPKGDPKTPRDAQITPADPEEDVHDTGEDDDDEEDDVVPSAITDMKDDHIKSDFDDEDGVAVANKSQ